MPTALALLQLVHPVACGGGRGRHAGSGRGRCRRSGHEDLAGVDCGGSGSRQWEVGRPLDGGLVVSPQKAQAGSLLLGLLCLLLTVHLLLEKPLKVLLQQERNMCQSTENKSASSTLQKGPDKRWNKSDFRHVGVRFTDRNVCSLLLLVEEWEWGANT